MEKGLILAMQYIFSIFNDLLPVYDILDTNEFK